MGRNEGLGWFSKTESEWDMVIAKMWAKAFKEVAEIREWSRVDDEKRARRRKRLNDIMRKSGKERVAYEKAFPPHPKALTLCVWRQCPHCLGQKIAVGYASWKELYWSGDIGYGGEPRLFCHHHKFFCHRCGCVETKDYYCKSINMSPENWIEIPIRKTRKLE